MKRDASPWSIVAASLAAVVGVLLACGTASAQTTWYWRGLTDTVWNGADDNWSTDKAGTTPASSLPTTTSDLVFASDVATSGTLATTLGDNFSINSLRFEPGTTTPTLVTIGPGGNPANSLTIGAGGITMVTSAPNATISAPVVVDTTQTWTVAAARRLDATGAVSGTGALTIASSGTLGLLAANSYSGGTTFSSAGRILLGNDNAFGSGPVSITGGGYLVASGGSRTITNDVTLGGSLYLEGSENLKFTGTFNPSGSRTIFRTSGSGTLELAGFTNLSVTGGASSFGINSVSTTIFSGTMINGTNGSSSFSKSGGGRLIVTGSMQVQNSYNAGGGALIIDGGRVAANAITNVATGAGITAQMQIRNGGTLTTPRVLVSASNTGSVSAGSIVVDGGTLNVTGAGGIGGAGLLLGQGTDHNGYGGLMLKSGTVNITAWLESRSTLLSATAASVVRIDGGLLTTGSNYAARIPNSELTVTGGTYSASAGNIQLSTQVGGTSVLNVTGGLLDNGSRAITVKQLTSGSFNTGITNLNGGRLITGTVTIVGGSGFVNFNGGTLEPGATGGTLVDATMTAAYVNGPFGAFAGGAVIDTNGKNTTIAEPMLAPTGSGLSGLTLSAAGTGYFGAPLVQITGGGGSGATGYATVDVDPASATFGRLTGVVLTNPGVGYTSTPTITLLGGGGSGASVTPGALVANTSGGLRKLGSGTLTLSAANTYSGTTTIEAGTLALGSAGTFASSSRIVVGNAGSSNTVLDLTAKSSFAFSAGQTVAGIGTVNIGTGKTVSSAGIWAPGNSIGSNNVTGSLTLTGTSQFELGTPGTSTSAPGTSDFTAVSETLTLGGALQLLDNAGADGNGSAGGGVYRLFTYGSAVSGSYASVTAPAATRTSLANITYGGAGTGSGQGVFLSLYNLATATSAQTVNLGNFHVGDTATQSVTLTNTAPANATYTETLGTGGFTSTTAGFTATGSASGIAGQASGSGTLLVGFTTGSAGARSGATVLGLTSSEVNSSGLGTVSSGSQTITITGTVWNLAGATVASGTTVNFGTVLKNTPLSQSLSIANTAPANGFSEKLSAAFGSATGGAGSTGSWSLLSAGGTSTAVGVSLGSGSAGAASGTQAINFTSDGDGTSGLGLTTIGSQTVSLAATVLDPALASFASGSTSLSLLLDFGEVQQNDVVAPLGFSLFNLSQTAGFTADLALLEIDQTAPSGPLGTNLSLFNSLVAGDSDSFAATFSTGNVGSFSNVLTLTLKSANSGTAYVNDTPQTMTLTVTGVVVVPEPGALALAGIGIAAAAWAVCRRRLA